MLIQNASILSAFVYRTTLMMPALRRVRDMTTADPKSKTNWKNLAVMAVIAAAAGIVPLEYRAAHGVEALRASAPILSAGVAILFFVARALFCDVPSFQKHTDASDN